MDRAVFEWSLCLDLNFLGVKEQANESNIESFDIKIEATVEFSIVFFLFVPSEILCKLLNPMFIRVVTRI